MTYQEIKKALKNNRTLIWEDPIPIEGNDYTIQKIWDYDNGETARILYGPDNAPYFSEAQVFLSEIKLKKLDIEEFHERIESLIEEIEDLISEMPYKGDSETKSQKIYLINQLNQFHYAVNGIEEEDFEF